MGDLPIIMAADADQAMSVSSLITCGAKVNRTRKGDLNSALHVAAKHGRIELVRMLVQAGAYPLNKNHDGLVPADLTDDTAIQRVLAFMGTSFACGCDAYPCWVVADIRCDWLLGRSPCARQIRRLLESLIVKRCAAPATQHCVPYPNLCNITFVYLLRKWST